MAPLTILCATVGRPTLKHTLDSVREQLGPGDAFWLLSDGPAGPGLNALWEAGRLAGRLIEVAGGPHGDWGHTPRNLVLPQAGAGYVLHIDDDDAFAPGALAAVRRAILRRPGALFLFRMAYPDGSCLWHTREVRCGNVGTPMFVHPAGIEYGRWAGAYGGDHHFIADTIRLNPERAVEWESAVVARIRPPEGAAADRWYPPPAPDGPDFDLGGTGHSGPRRTVNMVPPADVLADFTDLDRIAPEDRSVRSFFLSHALEHVPVTAHAGFLRDMFRKLAPGGHVRVIQSDADAVIQQYVDGALSFRAMRTVLFTPADRIRLNPWHLHHNMWSAEELARDFRAVGFAATTFDAGTWGFDMADELCPDDVRRYHGVPIRNLGVLATKPADRVPNRVHFVFGLREDFGGRPFGLVHYLAVRSAALVNRPDRMQIWYAHEPTGEWWERALELAEGCRLDTDFAAHAGVPRDHYAHRADLARLHVLREYGGIYLDLDTICVRPFGDLRQHPCVLGWEDPGRQHLCNAVILAEPGAEFIERLLTSQDGFRPGMWGEICIVEAGRLAHALPGLVRAVDPQAFHHPSWAGDGFELMHRDGATEFPGAYCHHLWEHVHWASALRDLTVEAIRSGTSNFCRIVRPFLP